VFEKSASPRHSLSPEEADLLVSQNVIPSRSRLGGSVLTGHRAIEVNIAMMRAFVRMRELMLTHEELFRRIEDMELRYDEQFQTVFAAIRNLIEPPDPPRKPIGFIPNA
jgi:hypothetical protein